MGGTKTADYRIISKPELSGPVLVAGWIDDVGEVGERTLDYLIEGAGCQPCAEVLPEGFFPMAGVSVEDDVAQFPECVFYSSSLHNLLIFKSSIPRNDWYRFLIAVLNVSEKFGVSEIYTVGAMVSAAAHTMPRVLVGVVNDSGIKDGLEPYNVMAATDFQTPSGQKPALSSYLSWVARQRDIGVVNLWVPVPFYLLQVTDPRACKRLIYFFNDRYKLGLDFTAIDAEISAQNSKISRLYTISPEIEAFVRRLETGTGLEAEQSEKLVREVSEYLKKG